MMVSRLNRRIFVFVMMALSIFGCRPLSSEQKIANGLVMQRQCTGEWKQHKEWIENEFAEINSKYAYWLFRRTGDLSIEEGYVAIYRDDGGYFFRSANVRSEKPFVAKISRAAFLRIRDAFDHALRHEPASMDIGERFPKQCFAIVAKSPDQPVVDVRVFSSDEYENGMYGLSPVDPIYAQILVDVAR